MPADVAQTPPDPAMQEVDLKKAKAELRKLRAEARQAELPTLPTEVPSGALDAGDKGSAIGVLAAYRALDLQVGARIAQTIPKGTSKLWIVPDDRPSRFKATRDLVSSQLDRFEREIREATNAIPTGDPQPRLLPAGVLLAAAALPMLMSLFKTDVSIRGRDVAMSFNAIAFEVAKRLAARQEPPAVFIAGVSAVESGALTEKAQELEVARDALANKLFEYRGTKVTEPNAELAASAEVLASAKAILQAEAAKASPGDLQGLADNVTAAARTNANHRLTASKNKALAEAVQEVIDTVDDFLDKLRTTDASGMTPLSIADTFALLADAHVLFLEASFAGGESVYEAVTAKKDRGLHMGAVVVSHALMGPDGAIISTDITSAEEAATTLVGEREITWETTRQS